MPENKNRRWHVAGTKRDCNSADARLGFTLWRSRTWREGDRFQRGRRGRPPNEAFHMVSHQTIAGVTHLLFPLTWQHGNAIVLSLRIYWSGCFPNVLWAAVVRVLDGAFPCFTGSGRHTAAIRPDQLLSNTFPQAQKITSLAWRSRCVPWEWRLLWNVPTCGLSATGDLFGGVWVKCKKSVWGFSSGCFQSKFGI